MAHYLIEVGYTPQSWSTQIENPASAADRITPALKACGGKLESMYYAFGDSDLVAIVDFKAPTDAAAFALAVTAGGALRSFKTTALLTLEEGIASMKLAGELRAKYSPPTTVNLTDKQPATAR
ncbi:MAG: hypothetical protein QOK42_26 [Frankiaceae bacterium]|jgi:uncharacterized protein with GYD domain|nr:hypothetical protein [Frankiaceae bacterium]MDX6275328.1 hypothetical protein [Frankiales bacterium]